jgi:WD40 repeat protein
VVTASNDETARVWDVETRKVIAVLRAHAGYVKSAVFSPDGKHVVTGSADQTSRLWDAGTGNEIAVLRAHAGEVWRAAFSPDGKRVVTASLDDTARVWDAESGKEIAILRGHPNWVASAAFSPDGKRVVTAAQDYRARIWDVSWATHVRGEELRERVCAEKLMGVGQEFSSAELEDPILRVIDVSDPIARNPCLRRGPLSLDYWMRLSGQLWRSTLRLMRMN